MSRLRTWALPVGALATALLVYLEGLPALLGSNYGPTNPPPAWYPADGSTIRTVATIAFWILAIVLVVILFEDRKKPESKEIQIEGPAFTRFLFNNSAAGLFWLPIRLFVGFSWLEAGLHKFNDPAWTTGGKALAGYWTGAVALPETGRPPISFEWYRDFINLLLTNNAAPWFSWLIIVGEIAVGLGLLFGLLTGIAAFFGALMNMSFLLAGSASTNPVLFTLAIGLILAWKVAGYYGLDRYVLPMLGTPWRKPVRIQPAPGAATT